MNKIFLLCFFFFAHAAFAQNTFYKSYKTGSAAEGHSVLALSDGYAFAGVTTNSIQDTNYVFLIKTNFSGDTLWSHTFHLKATFYINYNNSIQQTADGGFFITGYSLNAGESDSLVLMRTDSMGNILWTKLTGEDSTVVAGESIQPTPDGGYIIGGEFFKNTGALYILLMKIDSTGNTLWTKAITVDFDAEATCVKPTADGGYIITGEADYRIYLVKTDSLGRVQWSNIYPTDAPYDIAYSVQQVTGGGYMVSGTTLNSNLGVSRIFLMKTNKDGDVLWMRGYAGFTGFTTTAKGGDAFETQDKGFVVAGHTVQGNNGSDYTCLIKTDSVGDVVWSRTYGTFPVTESRCLGVKQTSDSGFVITGNGIDALLIKTDSLGRVNCSDSAIAINASAPAVQVAFGLVYDSTLNCASSMTQVITGNETDVSTICIPIGIDELNGSQPLFSIYPNPAHERFKITINGAWKMEDGELEIIDVTGRVVHEQKINSSLQDVNFQLVSGIYLVKLRLGERQNVQKVVLN